LIEYNIVELPYSEALPELQLKLNGYRRFWERAYLGATTAPEFRWAQHAPNGWEKMVLLYKAYNTGIARTLERNLISYAQNCNFRLDIENIRRGGEGLKAESGDCYVYLLVADRR